MPALLDPALLVGATAILCIAVAVGGYAEKARGKAARAAWRSRKQARGKWAERGTRERAAPSRARPLEPSDPAEQLRIVSEAQFAAKRLMNMGEWRVFTAAERACAELGQGWRVHAQVSLGEVLTSPDPDAHRCINAKRVDMLVISKRGEPLAAIEYQGQGHHAGTTAPARDAVKKEALRRAGVRLVEITHEHGPDDVRRELGRIAELEAARPGETSKAA